MIHRILLFGIAACLAVSAACAQSPKIPFIANDPRCPGVNNQMYKLENLNKEKTVYATLSRRSGRATDAPDLSVTVPPGQTVELFCVVNENEKIYMTVEKFHY